MAHLIYSMTYRIANIIILLLIAASLGCDGQNDLILHGSDSSSLFVDIELGAGRFWRLDRESIKSSRYDNAKDIVCIAMNSKEVTTFFFELVNIYFLPYRWRSCIHVGLHSSNANEIFYDGLSLDRSVEWVAVDQVSIVKIDFRGVGLDSIRPLDYQLDAKYLSEASVMRPQNWPHLHNEKGMYFGLSYSAVFQPIEKVYADEVFVGCKNRFDRKLSKCFLFQAIHVGEEYYMYSFVFFNPTGLAHWKRIADTQRSYFQDNIVVKNKVTN